MIFAPINRSTLITANNQFIDFMKLRDSSRFSDFNSYSTNPNVVFPLTQVPWNGGYNTIVAINKTHVGLPVFKNENVEFFVGMVETNVGDQRWCMFQIFYSKQRHGKTIKLNSWAWFNERMEIYFDKSKFAQKFGVSLEIAQLVLSLAMCQASRIYWLGGELVAENAREKIETLVSNAIASHPKYAGKIRRHNARMRLKSATEVQNSKTPATEVAYPTTTHYVFTMGDKVVGGGKFLNDFCARTEANRVLMKAIIEGASADSVMRIHRQIEVCAFKLSFNEV